MFTGKLDNLGSLLKYPKTIRNALKYLKDNFDNLKTMKPGEYKIHENMILQVWDILTECRQNKFPEVHRKYIDIQTLIKGTEKMSFFVDTNNEKVRENLLKERDIMFYENNSEIIENTIEMSIGTFVVFFPEDAHIPGIVSGDNHEIRKVVLKVPYEDTLKQEE